jgi:ATP-dependent Clp protease adapter protein ClpS
MPQYWPDEEGGVATEQETRPKVDKPRMYKVLLHNDNYTTMEFVVLVLIAVFHKAETEAVKIMLECWTYTTRVSAWPEFTSAILPKQKSSGCCS